MPAWAVSGHWNAAQSPIMDLSSNMKNTCEFVKCDEFAEYVQYVKYVQ
jgi:hypothetical protein